MRKIEISRPDKSLFPDGTTKADLAGYYEAVSQFMLPHIKQRPLNLERYPDGIDRERIMQQKASPHFPSWIRRARVPKKGGTVDHVVAADAPTLIYLAGQACITLHNWLSRSDRLDHPDRLIIDLDPSDGRPADVRRAALRFGELFRELGLEPFAMATGSRGYHVVAPLRRRDDFDSVRAFARDIADLAAAREPRRLTTAQRKAGRAGRILVDVMRTRTLTPQSRPTRYGRARRHRWPRRSTGASSRNRAPARTAGRSGRCRGGSSATAIHGGGSPRRRGRWRRHDGGSRS